ncbi:MAG: DUF2023 family protein [Treponema sp.]|nr:DUF2023 family protein [Treponema sp.]
MSVKLLHTFSKHELKSIAVNRINRKNIQWCNFIQNAKTVLVKILFGAKRTVHACCRTRSLNNFSVAGDRNVLGILLHLECAHLGKCKP